MRVVIVYESLFGNTRQVAEAIAEGIRDAAPDVHVRWMPTFSPSAAPRTCAG